MNNHRFTLEPYKGPSSRYTCPACGLKHQLVRYIDNETGLHLADHVGRCNRAHRCGYHHPPKEFFKDNPQLANHSITHHIPKPMYISKPAPPDYMPGHVVAESMGNYTDNHFVSFLRKTFGADTTRMLVQQYKIGTNHYWDSSTVFWQIDAQGRTRTGKVMLYNPVTGKRLKEQGKTFINWMHKIMEYDNYNLKQCLFGEHLLPCTTLPIAITESEKTAIIASVYMPEMVWLAAGSLHNLCVEKLQACSGRSITLFPDAGAYKQWAAIAATVPNCTVAPFIEGLFTADEQSNGYDLADYLLGQTG